MLVDFADMFSTVPIDEKTRIRAQPRTESLSEELKGAGVTMSAMCPGVTATPMMDTLAAGNPLFNSLIGATVLEVDEVSNAGYKAGMAGRVVHVPGRVNLITTLSSRALPNG